MQRIKVNESVAARRRVFLALRQEDGVLAWNGTVTGIKPLLSVGGAAAAASTNDIVKLAAGLCYIELEQAEVAVALGPLGITVEEDATSTGLAQHNVTVEIVPFDPYGGASFVSGGQQGVISF